MWSQNKLCLLMSRHKLCNHFQVTFPHHAFLLLASKQLWMQPFIFWTTFTYISLEKLAQQMLTDKICFKKYTGQLKSKACQPDSSMCNSAMKSRKVWKTWLWSLMRENSACPGLSLRQGPPNFGGQAGHWQIFLYRLGLRSCCTQQHALFSFLSLTDPKASWQWRIFLHPSQINLNH